MQVDDNPVDLGHVCFYLVLYDLVRSTMVMYGMVQNNFAWSSTLFYYPVQSLCIHACTIKSHEHLFAQLINDF